MWPWAHLGFGYLLLSATERGRGRRPEGFQTLALAIGTQFPDLIDKPFGWTLALLPSGRSLAHSLFFAAAAVALVWILAAQRGRAPVGVGFAVGYASHLVGDSLTPVVAGEYGAVSFLLWPLVPLHATDAQTSILAHFANLDVTSHVVVGLLLFAVAIAAWVRDGAPGIRLLSDRLGRRLSPS